MLMAEGTYITPDFVPANEFLNLEGDKISTSRNHAVWLHEYLQDFPDRQDELRYVLTSIAPETSDSNFSWKDYQARVNNELADILGNYVKRVVDLVHRFCEGKNPNVEGINLEEEGEYLLNSIKTEASINSNLENFKFREAQNLLMDLARQGNQFLQITEPWKLIKTDPRKVDKILNISLFECVKLTRLMFPFLPHTAKRLCRTLNLPEDVSKWNEILENGNLKTGHPINTSEVLFPKITDEEIEKQIEKLKKVKEGTEGQGVSETGSQETRELVEAKPAISYEDFSKLDIRIGTILEAERVPKTDKLLKLLIDTGLDKRTVISGIAGFYEAEKIIGQKVSILVNLQPRKLKGIESHGMILMAENPDGKLSFVLPSEDVENGSTVS
jgi:methionyl-tRNA synthetase